MLNKPDTWIGFDFETSGLLPEYALQPWRVAQGKAWPTSLVYLDGTEIEGGILDVDGNRYQYDRTRAMIANMLEVAVSQKRPLVGWNTAFDISWCLAFDLKDLVFKAKWLDGMLLWRHFFIEPEYDEDRSHKKSYGLKTYVEEFFPDEAGYEDDIDFHDPSVAARERLHRYNIRDVDFTLNAARSLWSRLLPRQRRAALIEAESLPMIAQANLRGLPVDTLIARELEQNCDDIAAKCLEELAPHGVTETIVRSPAKLGRLLFDEWKLPVLKENTGKKTGNITRATDKEVLHELAFIDPRAKRLRDFREALNLKTKFASAPIISAAYNDDGCAHPLAHPFGTYSGRLTYGSKQGKNKDARPIGFALHQMKRGPKFRNVITCMPGCKLVEFDAAGQEFRWMAIFSQDETMLELCLPGEDPHSYMGAGIVDYDYRQLITEQHDPDKVKQTLAKSYRNLGKLANLSLQYRTSAKKLRVVARVDYLIPMEMPEAIRIHATYQKKYRGVPKYWERQIRETKEKGYVETAAGRRVQVVGNWIGRSGWSMGSTGINYKIQGTGADQKYLAMACLKDQLNKFDAHFAWDLHDGIYMWVPEAKVDHAVDAFRQTLNNLPYKEAWGFTPPIPLPWDCKEGGSWGTLRERAA